MKGQRIEETDPLGGVFHPVPEKPITVAYSWGPKGPTRNVMLTCPVSAIPDAIWELLALWWQARLLGMPLVAGGFMDQPAIIRLAFPIFEGEHRLADRGNQENRQQGTAMMAAAAMARMMGGGR